MRHPNFLFSILCLQANVVQRFNLRRSQAMTFLASVPHSVAGGHYYHQLSTAGSFGLQSETRTSNQNLIGTPKNSERPRIVKEDLEATTLSLATRLGCVQSVVVVCEYLFIYLFTYT